MNVMKCTKITLSEFLTRLLLLSPMPKLCIGCVNAQCSLISTIIWCKPYFAFIFAMIARFLFAVVILLPFYKNC